MRRTILGLLLIFIAFPVAMPVPAQAVQERISGPIHAEWPDLDFNAAYDDFIKGNFAAASREIREGANFLLAAAERSSGSIEKDLLRTYDELKELAKDIEEGAVKSPSRLRRAFSHAHQVLAEYYAVRLRDSWLKKESETADRELRLAASNLERSISWVDEEMKEKTEKLIKELRELGEKLAQRAESLAGEIEKSIKEIEEELNKLQDRIARGGDKQ